MGRTLAEKIWSQHVVRPLDDGADLLYVDLHVLHEVNTPRAFDDLRASGRTVRRPDRTLAVEDHNTPTRQGALEDLAGRRQRELIRANCAEFGIPLHRLGDADQGIVHVIVPELGLAQPGMTIVCCDSHTSTLGAMGVLAFGIGTGQVEHVLATQTLPVHRPGDLAVEVSGALPDGATAKDLALALIAQIGTGGGQGSIIEYRGEAVRGLSVEGRMTLCNMSIEAGSRAGLVAADDTTIDYLRGRLADRGRADAFAEAEPRWRAMRSDDDARFDDVVHIDAAAVGPRVSWGTNPAQNLLIDGSIPTRADFATEEEWASARRSLDYMGLRPGQAVRDLSVSTVFLGSCTNGRIEDLRDAAAVLAGRRVADDVHLLIVPGSAAVRRQAEAEGLDKVFAEAGADFREGAGCSMCCALNEDRLAPGERAASTSNRNFEGRQGKQSRTHLVSPRVAAATAVSGRLTTPEDL
ncbi:3-isopropylmalate dehydratase large subunit [Streptomyces sp. NPDC057718]|uniref:3-isopropylmalate dehydratase large subunit n=1 Tax=Streptomyces sp. NPDC057718 TaxID=3346225 RepID=UPI0036CB8CDD